MKYLLLMLTLLSFFSFTPAQTQNNEVTTIVVLPFDAISSAQSYGLSLPIAVARHLNVIDNVYVPPVGDVFLLIRRLQAEGNLSVARLAEAYQADYIVSGKIDLLNNDNLLARVQLGFANSQETIAGEQLELNLNTPQEVVESTLLAVISSLNLNPSTRDRNEIEAILAQLPSLTALPVVTESASRIQVPNFSRLQAVAELEPYSSWVLTERARAATLNNTLGSARSLAEDAVSYNASDIEAWLVLAQIAAVQNDVQRSQEAVTQVLSLNPNYAEGLEQQGQLSAQAGNSGAAQSQLIQALALNPRLVDGYIALAGVQTGAVSLQTIRQGISALPEARELQRAFVARASELGDSAGAQDYVRNLVNQSTNPRDYELLSLLDDSQVVLQLAQEGQRRFPNAVEPYLAEASAYLQQGDSASAISRLETALSLNPDNITLRNQLALTYARQGNLEQATTLLKESNQSSTVQYNLAQIYLEAEQPQAAVDALEPFLSSYANDPEALQLYALALAQLGRRDQALNSLERARELAPNDSEIQNFIQQLENAPASSAASNNDTTNVEDISGLTVQQREIFERAIAQLEAGQAENALAELSNARAYGDSAVLAFYAGVAAQASQQLQVAIDNYQTALTLAGDNSLVLNNLGFAYYQQGEFNTALAYLQQAVALDDSNAQAQLNLALIQYSQGNIADAALPLERALALEPQLADTEVTITQTDNSDNSSQQIQTTLRDLQADIAQRSQGGTEVVEGFDSFIAEAALPYFQDGLAALQAGDFTLASDAFSQAQVYGDNPVIAFYQGFSQQALGNYGEAISAYERALVDAPENAVLLNNLGMCHYFMNDTERSLGYLARAIQADDSNVRAQVNLGLVNYSLGRYRSAIKPLERALELDPQIAAAELELSDGQVLTFAQLLAESQAAATP